MRRDRLLLLYPPAWRDRYGEEFLAVIGTGPLSAGMLVDIVGGAIDAWSRTCVSARGVTPRDGVVGAAVMIAGAWACKALGQPTLAFPLSFTLSMPFWLMKGTPWRAQAAIVGVTSALLVLIR